MSLSKGDNVFVDIEDRTQGFDARVTRHIESVAYQISWTK